MILWYLHPCAGCSILSQSYHCIYDHIVGLEIEFFIMLKYYYTLQY